MGMCLNGWGPTLEAIAGEILIRYLYLALSCLATLLITSFFLLVSNQTWAFLSGFILNGISFGLNVNRHLSLFYDFLIPNTYFLLLVMFPMLLVLILILVFIVRLEIFRKDW